MVASESLASIPAISIGRIDAPSRRKRDNAFWKAAAIAGSTSGIGSGVPSSKSSGLPTGCPNDSQRAIISPAVCVKKPSVSRLFARGSTPSMERRP